MIAGIEVGMSMAVGGGAGFVVGAFTPAIGRKIKALFVKDATSLKAEIASAQVKLAAVEAKDEAAIKKV